LAGRRDRLLGDDAEVHPDVLVKALIAGGEDQQAVDEALIAMVDFQQGFAELARCVGHIWIVERHFDEGAVYRQWRPQFVGRVGHEAALSVERAVQPFQHRVEGVGEFLDFVVGPVERDAFVQIAFGHPPRGRGDVLQRLKRPAGQEPAEAARGDADRAERGQ
jgi:hypothetical protein